MVILYILAGAVGLLLAYLLALKLYEHTGNVRYRIRLLRLELEQRRISQARQIYPNPDGVYPALWDGETALDINRGIAFDFSGLRSVTPELVKTDSWVRVLSKAGWPVGAAADNLLPSPDKLDWPEEVPLKSVCPEPDIHSLVLGMTIDERGRHTVKADMGRLVHIAVGGSSGWGKSAFLRSLAYQLALSQTLVDLVMIDLEGATLAPFAKCGRLLYPIADTEADALAVLLALQDEMERRKGLYATLPGVDSLAAYNARADAPLVALVAVIDEATALLGDKSVESALRTLALRARKYGLWLVMAGQDWKATSLDTAIRNQLSSRIQFRAMSKSQSRVLLEQSGAEDLDVAGRAMAILPGSPLFTMQAPFVSAKTILADVSDGGARWPMPEASAHDPDLAERVRALHSEGLGLCAIADEIFGYHNAAKTGEIKQILAIDN